MDLQPNPNPEILAMEDRIKEIVGGPTIIGQNGFADSDIYLARSWLIRIHCHLRREQGVTDHASRPSREQRELLVGVGNRLTFDIEVLLEACPYEEVRMIYDALEESECDGYERRDPQSPSIVADR